MPFRGPVFGLGSVLSPILELVESSSFSAFRLASGVRPVGDGADLLTELDVKVFIRLPDLMYSSYLEGLEAELVFTSWVLPACLLSLPRPLLVGLCVGDLRLLLSALGRLAPADLGDVEVNVPVF